MPVFHGNYVRNHACVPAVSVCEWMDFRNKLVMESNQAFIDGECFVIDPILCVAEKPGDTLYDFCRITPGAHFMLAIGARPYRIKMPGRSRLERPGVSLTRRPRTLGTWVCCQAARFRR